MSYLEEHERWIKRHLAIRKGERLDALKRGHGYGNQLFAERIWWPLVGHFLGLHPEYEVKDLRGRSYFVDFMWLVGSLRIVFEIMDYGSHGTDRTKYRQDMNRGLYLQAQDCLVHCISLDELKENPAFVLSVLRSIIAPYLAAVNGGTGVVERQYGKVERELMRAAIRNNRIVRPMEAARELELHKMTVIKYCRQLVQKGKFRAVARGKTKRVNYYEYIGTLQSSDLV
jgi:hypothetical protein